MADSEENIKPDVALISFILKVIRYSKTSEGRVLIWLGLKVKIYGFRKIVKSQVTSNKSSLVHDSKTEPKLSVITQEWYQRSNWYKLDLKKGTIEHDSELVEFYGLLSGVHECWKYIFVYGVSDSLQFRGLNVLNASYFASLLANPNLKSLYFLSEELNTVSRFRELSKVKETDPGKEKTVDVVISTKNNSLIFSSLVEILLKTDKIKSVTVISNNPTFAHPNSTLRLNSKLAVIDYNFEFNFSRQSNIGSKMGNAEFVLFLNDDIYPLHPDWLSDLIETATETSGIVGSTLLYPDGKVQHAGMFYKPDLSFHHLSRYTEGRKLDYFEHGEKFKPVSVVTGAAMLVDRVFFEDIGGFDENLGHYLQDVDLCLKASLSGVSIYQTGRPLGMHFESLTIRGDLQNENVQRLRENEHRYFLRKWASRIVRNDPWVQNYSPEMLTDNVR